jgi:ribosomal protein S12 methylthiotransferase accessory factor
MLLVDQQHILDRYHGLQCALEKEFSSSQDRHQNLGGTIRALTPEATLKKLQPLLPTLGITRVANITGLDNIGVPVYVSIRPNAKHLSTSQGKSFDPQLAKISAIMESIEGYHLENPPKAELIGSYEQLAKEYDLINIQRLVPGPFHHEAMEKLVLRWIGGINLMNNKLIFVPHALVELNSSQINLEWNHLNVSSNGVASGNTLSEALCHALYEIIERDAICHWMNLSAEDMAATSLDPAKINCSRNNEILINLHKADLTVNIWDATTSLNIPTFYASIKPKKVIGSNAMGTYWGSGTHLAKDIALSRALTEAIQSRATMITGTRDDVFPEQYERQKKQQYELIEQAISFTTTAEHGQRDYAYCAAPTCSASFQENIQAIKTSLQQHGCPELIVINHTKSEFDIPVVQVIVPGMRFNGYRI